jgi:hypothetical protein
MKTLAKDIISPAELAGLIRVVQLARELQSSAEFKDKDLGDCILEAAFLIRPCSGRTENCKRTLRSRRPRRRSK